MPGWGELFVEEVVDKCGEVKHVQLMDNSSCSMLIILKIVHNPKNCIESGNISHP